MSYPIDEFTGRVYIATGATVAAAAATATIPASSTQLAYLSGFQVTGTGATTQTCVNVTVLGIQGTAAGHSGTMTYKFQVATGGTAACTPLVVAYYPPLPAVAAGSAITVDIPSFGSGNLHAAVTAQGYRK